ncbi:MAG: alpha/beta hydrolase, partial [Pseudomonadota bacterium]
MLLNLIITLIIVYLIVVLLVYFGQSRLIYFPEQQISNIPSAIGLDYTPVNIPASDGETLHGWWMSVPDAKGTVLFFHGNAGNISHRINYLTMFKR